MSSHRRIRLALALCAIALLPAYAAAQDLASFEKSVTEFTLGNGLHFIILERHDAPVVSFHTFANAGSVDDPKGQTGLAHMFEHMAFKGTPIIGSTDWAREKVALDAVDEAYEAWLQERHKGIHADEARVSELRKAFQDSIEKAAAFAEGEEFTRLIEQSGGTGLNASTSSDETQYFYSLPSNRAELWFYLESERFLNPVFRDFYKERDVVREERRMRTESSPVGKLIEAFLAASYQAHPYGWPPVGWASDIDNFGVPEAREFFKTYYAPVNLTIAIAGDVDPARMKSLAQAYFGRLEKRPPPPAVLTEEPQQLGERRIEIESQAQPLVVIGFKKPSKLHPDRAVFDVISSILSDGRTSWLYTDLVRDRQIALQAGGFPDFPGSKYTSLFLFYAFPTSGHSVAENEKAMYGLIDKMRNEPVDAETLNRVKAKARANLIGALDSNAGLARQLASNEAGYGDWRQLFRWLDEMNKVTAEDVQRVAREYFKKENRTVAYLVPPSEEPQLAPASPKESAQ